jgi:hypothetical protein
MMTQRIATRILRHANGAETRVPAHILAPPRITASMVARYGSYEKAREAGR